LLGSTVQLREGLPRLSQASMNSVSDPGRMALASAAFLFCRRAAAVYAPALGWKKMFSDA